MFVLLYRGENLPQKNEKNKTAFKEWLNVKAAQQIAQALVRAYPGFESDIFLKNINTALSPLELKARMQLLKDRMTPLLPSDPKKSLPILIEALSQNESDQEGLRGFLVWPLTHYVAEECLNNHKMAMSALYKMTQVFTSEFAVRPFLLAHEEETLKQLNIWCEDDNEHVRRWTSEGTRPLLPWGVKIKSFVENPNKSWSILERLKDDPSSYVQKSVANHINDHSKSHIEWVLNKMKEWKTNIPIEGSRREWIIRHGTRTLVKKGNPKALLLHGIRQSRNVLIHDYRIVTKKIQLGEDLRVCVTLENKGASCQEVLVDHQLHFLKSNGKHNVKVFKGKRVTLKGGEILKQKFSIPIKFVTTRRYYSGKQMWSPLVNGNDRPALIFNLMVPHHLRVSHGR